MTGFATDEAVDELAVEPGMVVCGLCEWQVVCDGGESDCAQSRLLFWGRLAVAGGWSTGRRAHSPRGYETNEAEQSGERFGGF